MTSEVTTWLSFLSERLEMYLEMNGSCRCVIDDGSENV